MTFSTRYWRSRRIWSCGRKISNLEKEPSVPTSFGPTSWGCRWVVGPEMGLDWEGLGSCGMRPRTNLRVEGLLAVTTCNNTVLMRDVQHHGVIQPQRWRDEMIASLCDAFYLDQGQWLQDDQSPTSRERQIVDTRPHVLVLRQAEDWIRFGLRYLSEWYDLYLNLVNIIYLVKRWLSHTSWRSFF